MNSSDSTIKKLAADASLETQEQLAPIMRGNRQLHIGIPLETSFQEKRVALSPESVGVLIANGHRVTVQSNAGKEAHFSDRLYAEAGADIVADAKSVYKAPIIVKVGPPSIDEIALMQHKQVLFSALQLSIQPEDFLNELIQKKITAIAWDYVKDQAGVLKAVHAMGEIAGNTSVLIASELLSNFNGGVGTMLGGLTGVKPAEVVIIGAGSVGEYATRAALGLGANVKIFDNNIAKLRRLQNNLGQRVYTSALSPTVLLHELRSADVAIGAMRAPHGRTPCVVTEEMVAQMKTGSVIIDVSIDQGGCFETSEITNHLSPTFVHEGVIHYCVPNIASRVSRTASYALSNIFTPILVSVGEEAGVENILKKDEGLREGVYLYNGILTKEFLGEAYGIPYRDINLLMCAF